MYKVISYEIYNISVYGRKEKINQKEKRIGMKQNRIELEAISPFKEMSSSKRKELDATAEMIELSSRQTLYTVGSPADKIYLLMTGGLKLIRKGQGRRGYILDFLPPGKLLGLSDALIGNTVSDRAVAMQPSIVFAWQFSKFMEAVEASATASKALNKVLANQIKARELQLEEQAVLHLRTKLVKLLHNLAENFGQKIKGGILINLKITHQDMADYFGASRESVTVMLSKFRKQGLIRFDVRKIIIPDMRALLKTI